MQREIKTTGDTSANSRSDAPLTFLTVEDVAERLKVPKSSVYELTRFRQNPEQPRLPARRVGHSLRFLSSDIDAWILALPLHTHLQKRKYVKKGSTRRTKVATLARASA